MPLPLTSRENRHQISYWEGSASVPWRQPIDIAFHKLCLACFNISSQQFTFLYAGQNSSQCLCHVWAGRAATNVHGKQENSRLPYVNSTCAERSTCHTGLLAFFGDFAARMRIGSFVGLRRWDVAGASKPALETYFALVLGVFVFQISFWIYGAVHILCQPKTGVPTPPLRQQWSAFG